MRKCACHERKCHGFPAEPPDHRAQRAVRRGRARRWPSGGSVRPHRAPRGTVPCDDGAQRGGVCRAPSRRATPRCPTRARNAVPRAGCRAVGRRGAARVPSDGQAPCAAFRRRHTRAARRAHACLTMLCRPRVVGRPAAPGATRMRASRGCMRVRARACARQCSAAYGRWRAADPLVTL